MPLSMLDARKRLACIWFVGVGVNFICVFLLAFTTGDVDHMTELWSWFLPNVMPTLSLIVSILIASSSSRSNAQAIADIFIYRMTAVLSVLYLLAVMTTFLAKPFSPLSFQAILRLSHLWLAPLQGLVAATIGTFFIRSQR